MSLAKTMSDALKYIVTGR
ncbi:hypothetical protein ID866_10330 [Astraeus odoratus]|nr:hypothetical protein ID866_10330 [Astraeus odoratus]